jgi:electron transfer flavoprotein beta subunit
VIREVPDTEATITIGADGQTIDTSAIKFILNPYDEYAIEAGAQLVEAGNGECTLIAVGGADMTKTIRNAIAKAADKAGNIAFSKVIHLVTDEQLETHAVAAHVAEVAKGENADIVFTGKQYIDDDNFLMAPYLSEKLGFRCVTVVTGMEVNGDMLTVTREIEGGTEKYDVKTPVVISLQKGVNEPRYAGMKGIMKAKKVEIESKPISLTDKLVTITKIEQPAQKAPGRIISGDNAVADLVKALRDEAKVI